MNRLVLLLAASLMAVSLAANGSIAQPLLDLGGPAADSFGRPPLVKPGSFPLPPDDRHRKHLEQLRMFKLLELLDLSEDQEDEFIVAFRRQRRKHRDLDRRRMALVDSMAVSLRGKVPAEKAIYRAADKLAAMEAEGRALRDRFINRARSILTAQQFGRLIIFESRFELEMLRTLNAFRSRGGRGKQRGFRDLHDSQFTGERR
ncbi:MAG: hypothetical protein ACE5FH_00575 [Candidatus Zixiibacteriota bacterium]